MSDTQIEKFDPAKLMQGVRDRIKSTFVSLIPDDQWEKMVQKEIDDFFSVSKEKGYYNNVKRTEFQELAYSVIQDECKKRLEDYLKSEGFNTTWDGYGKPVISEKVNKLLVENSAEIFTTMMGQMFQNMLSQYANSIRNNGNPY